MLLCRVEGNVVATRKHPSLDGWKLTICQPIGRDGAPEGSPQVAIDAHGANIGQLVIISSDGQATRKLVGDDKSPARWLLVGIVDENGVSPGERSERAQRREPAERSGERGAPASEAVGGSAGAKPPGERSERVQRSEPAARSGERGAPASDAVGGSAGAKPPGEK